jgi:hypothetical protein
MIARLPDGKASHFWVNNVNETIAMSNVLSKKTGL